MCRDSAQRVAEDYDDEDDDMMRMMWNVLNETVHRHVYAVNKRVFLKRRD